MNRNADEHPEHDRGGCKEHDPAYNAEAAGSHGCARCTALLMDQRDDLLETLQRLLLAIDNLGHAEGGLAGLTELHVAANAAQLVRDNSTGEAT